MEVWVYVCGGLGFQLTATSFQIRTPCSLETTAKKFKSPQFTPPSTSPVRWLWLAGSLRATGAMNDPLVVISGAKREQQGSRNNNNSETKKQETKQRKCQQPIRHQTTRGWRMPLAEEKENLVRLFVAAELLTPSEKGRLLKCGWDSADWLDGRG